MLRMHTETCHSIDPQERGYEMGRHHGELIAASVARYRHHFGVLGLAPDTILQTVRGCHDAVCDWAPALAAELAAMAAGAGLSIDDIHLLNARTEVLALAWPPTASECST